MKNGLLIAGMIALLLGAGACAGPSRVEMDYGTSVKLSAFNQTLNPQAGKNLGPVAGFDGERPSTPWKNTRRILKNRRQLPVTLLGRVIRPNNDGEE